MRTFITACLAAAALAGPAAAELKVGASAPSFKAPATLGGTRFEFSLDEALKSGPVLLYFYPAAFTKGCSLEAHEFADKVADFKALGVSVIGVSVDGIEKLDEFSKKDCSSKFPLVSDAGEAVTKSYDAALFLKPDLADRISYLITPDHKIAFAYKNLDASQHVALSYAAAQKWKSGM